MSNQGVMIDFLRFLFIWAGISFYIQLTYQLFKTKRISNLIVNSLLNCQESDGRETKISGKLFFFKFSKLLENQEEIW